MPIDHQRLADHTRVGVKALLPIRKAEHDNGIAVLRGVVGGNQETPDCGPHSQHIEVIAAYQFAVGELGLIVPAHPDLRFGVGHNAGENRVLVTELPIARV